MNEEIRYLDNEEVEQLAQLSEVLVRINRCAVVVKGGRRFSFSALNVSGNREGVVGLGYGKGRQVPSAIEKAARDARKHLQRVPITEAGSIPHELLELPELEVVVKAGFGFGDVNACLAFRKWSES